VPPHLADSEIRNDQDFRADEILRTHWTSVVAIAIGKKKGGAAMTANNRVMIFGAKDEEQRGPGKVGQRI
jgi:hypothetical protein